MTQGRNAATGLFDPPRIDFRGDEPHPLRRLGEHLAPGRDDEAVAIGAAAFGMLAILRRRKDEAAILDRPIANSTTSAKSPMTLIWSSITYPTPRMAATNAIGVSRRRK